MSSYTRKKCPAHNGPKPSDAVLLECTCGIRAAAKAAIDLRPIPDLAINTGATVAAAIALRRAGFENQASRMLASVEQTVVEANGGLLFALLDIKGPRHAAIGEAAPTQVESARAVQPNPRPESGEI